ncbi:unnamed protein product [Adineta steineri]|uniref:Transmembrane protein n=1 Tax=Adineta steineri TaxID=433720 RepID=A0A814Y427_9BILA|nr:unnamed protein product [Adineta steineri]CAF1242356.1 unnamed protein product [Adineta steineri]CAF3562170.1 unnamed protein product [Adineta steineri]
MVEYNSKKQTVYNRRQTMAAPESPHDELHDLARHLSASTNVRLPLSPVSPSDEVNRSARYLGTPTNVRQPLSSNSQIDLPFSDEYRSQERVPPAGVDVRRQFVSNRIGDSISNDSVTRRRLSIISENYYPIDDEDNQNEDNQTLIETDNDKRRRRILFVVEPILVGLILLPIIVLFWDCGWNLVWTLLNTINGYPLTINQEFYNYSFLSLFIPYSIVQILLLILYIGQEIFYNFLKEQNSIIRIILLKSHIFLLATIYIIQWEIVWLVWDQYTPRQWYFQLVLSIAAIFALIVFIGHLSDLVCAPFLVSYDSIEYCLHFGCPLLTRQMKQWKINVINYVLYEIIISNLSIVTWRSFYNFLDQHMYPDDLNKSALICLLIGFILYFPLMYFQNYLEYLNVKYEFWVFVSINFPQLYRNVRHVFAFLSCVFLWRGLWLLYDSYIVIFEFHYQTYLLLYFLSFFFLALIQTSSSINGPLSNMEDDNHFFPLYPNCYVSTVIRKFS